MPCRRYSHSRQLQSGCLLLASNELWATLSVSQCDMATSLIFWLLQLYVFRPINLYSCNVVAAHCIFLCYLKCVVLYMTALKMSIALLQIISQFRTKCFNCFSTVGFSAYFFQRFLLLLWDCQPFSIQGTPKSHHQ